MAQPEKTPPSNDPFMDEVHALKRAAAEEAGGDPQKLLEQLREIQKRYADRVVAPPTDKTSEDAA